ncbi:rod shape-determining protein MreD [Aurantivibrio plasticivorans]
MNIETQTHNYTVVVLSFVVAMCLSVYPLPDSWQWFRPEFVALLVIYWVTALPHQVGILTAFIVGLAQDIVELSVIGLHALCLVAVAYFCVLSYQRIRSYALWQQSLWVFVLTGIHQVFWNWAQSFSGPNSDSLMFLTPALVSAVMWPVILIVMEWVRIRTHVRQY